MRILSRGRDRYPISGETLCERCRTRFAWDREDLSPPSWPWHDYWVGCPECGVPNYPDPSDPEERV